MTGLPERVLVVAPHPDDDTIGCGGFIAEVARNGGHVTVAYVTDGSASHPDSVLFPPARVAAIREDEARAALRELGVDVEPVFLRYGDGTLSEQTPDEQQSAARAIARLIARVRPAAVLIPWRDDPHPDHVAVSALCEAALRDFASTRSVADRGAVDTLYYEVWLPVRGNATHFPDLGAFEPVVFPLDDATVERKRRALYAHASQTTGLIADSASGFRIGDELASGWLAPRERFYRARVSA